MNKIIIFALLSSGLTAQAAATEMTVELNHLDAGESAGTVVISNSGHGVVLTPNLRGLAPGLHGFHLHANGSCEAAEKDGKMVPGGAAGGHYDPDKTGKHSVPWDQAGHRGDLPALFVDEEGNASHPVLAPLLSMDDLKGRAIMVHAESDNYSDTPKPLGGGGARKACGVVGK